MNLSPPSHTITIRQHVVKTDTRARRLWRRVIQARLRASRIIAHTDTLHRPAILVALLPGRNRTVTERAAWRMRQIASARYDAFIAYCDSL